MAKHKFIKAATAGAHGQFRAKAERQGETTHEYAEKEKHAPGKTGKEARLALTLMGMHHKDRASARYSRHEED